MLYTLTYPNKVALFPEMTLGPLWFLQGIYSLWVTIEKIVKTAGSGDFSKQKKLKARLLLSTGLGMRKIIG